MSPSQGLQALERAIRLNQAAKKNLPGCPCWANAPQALDEDLYRALEAPAFEPERRQAQLLEAVRRHRESKQETPECTCWATNARKADLDLYAVLDELQAEGA